MMATNKSKCQLVEHPQFNTCCCKCANRLKLYDQFPNKSQVGWICVAAIYEQLAFVGDFEHGACEMFVAMKK